MTNPLVSMTAAEFEATALGDRLKQLMQLLDMLKGVDLSQLPALIAAIQAVTAATDLRDKIKAGIAVLALVATMTPTPEDDKLVAALQSVLTDDVLNVLESILGGMMGNMTTKDVTLTSMQRQQMQAAGIPWAFLVKIALQLLPLIEGAL